YRFSMAQVKYAVVVGCDYEDPPDCPMKKQYPELSGCINDANSVHDILFERFGFTKTCVSLLTDKPDSKIKPTAALIKLVLEKLLSGAKAGDVVFLFFAGHGTIIRAKDSSTKRDEQAIVASDLNLITRVDFRKILNGATKGVEFIIMSDSCNSGGLIDQAKEQIGPGAPSTRRAIDDPNCRSRFVPFDVIVRALFGAPSRARDNQVNVQTLFMQKFGADASLVFQNTPLPQNNRVLGRSLSSNEGLPGILMSGCQSNEEGQETKYSCGDGKMHGAFTCSVLKVLKQHPKPITTYDLVSRARDFIKTLQLKQAQHPCLYCSDRNVKFELRK
ncbi:caspase family protein, partial [Acinetobacter baumannii]